MIVGIKTITNQFVPVIPTTKIDDDLDEEKSYIGNPESNELIVDEDIITNTNIDFERQKVVKGIELESSFYNLFRNTLKILFTNEKYEKVKKEILVIIDKIELSYIEKFELIIEKLHNILDGVIEFTEIELDIIEDYDDLMNYFGLDENSRKATKLWGGCFMRQTTCKLTLPKFNLYNDSEKNEKIYFNRLTDELIRYSKIRNYI